MRCASLIGLVAAATLAAGCADLARYSGLYRGCLVAVEVDGFTPQTGALLSLHVENATCLPAACPEGPGLVTTNDGTFNRAPLTPVRLLPNDPLFELAFGSERVRNYLFSLTVSNGRHAGQKATAIVSLMKDDSVELRIVLGHNDLFGVFVLRRTTLVVPPTCPG